MKAGIYMNNYKLYISYDGTKYNGWQRQKSTNNTICQKLEAVVEKMCGKHVDIIGSGRTDAGVHAYKQVANFHLDTALSVSEIKKYFNDYLPFDIRVLEVSIASDRFHARLNALQKKYIYRIDNNEVHNIFNRKYSYYINTPLNIESMKEAANHLIGTHDFKSFSSTKKTKKSTIRKIYSINFSYSNDILEIEFVGNGFLYHMVRILTGTLIDVGLGKLNPYDVFNILEQEDRSLAGPTAPAYGLFLKDVIY